MKQIWSEFLSIFFIILGVCFLLFVLRMVWFPPNSMGMMMGLNMMVNHLINMFIQLILFAIIILVIIGLIWIIKRNKNKD